jgi:hypothetical protein
MMALYVKEAMASITKSEIRAVERNIESYKPRKKMRLPAWAKV